MRNSKDYHDLPFNPNLRERAKELRKAGNLGEVILWRQIKNGRLNGLDFDRQKIIGNYIVDFYCANRGVVIEIDGITHNDKTDYDKERDKFLTELGLTVIHILSKDVLSRPGDVSEFLRNHPSLRE